MEVHSNSFESGEPIPGRFAFCIPDPDTHATFAPNRNPHLAWSGAPADTASIAIICHDPDVPTKPDDVNEEGREVPSDLARTDFFHWVLVDLPPSLDELAEAAFADGVVAHGRSPRGPVGVQGLNDYTGWFVGDADMEGEYYGYDGPCPPWNDSIVHHYVFTVYALDVSSLSLSGAFSGADARAALEGHVLDEASLTGTYTLNPRLGA